MQIINKAVLLFLIVLFQLELYDFPYHASILLFYSLFKFLCSE